MTTQGIFADLVPKQKEFDSSGLFADLIPKKEKGFSEKANEVAGMVSDSLGSMKVPGVDEKILGMDLYADPAGEVFDPEGSGYDYESAKSAGITPDETGHWASRNLKTGQLLKGKKHKTWDLLEKGEKEAGYRIYKGEDGKYYSTDKSEYDIDYGDANKVPFSFNRIGKQSLRAAGKGIADVAKVLDAVEKQKGVNKDWYKNPSINDSLLFSDRLKKITELEGKEALTKARLKEERDRFANQKFIRERKEVKEFVDKFPELLEGSSGIVEDAVVGMASFLPAMGVSAINPLAGTAMTFAQIAGMKYDEFTKAGVKEDHALNAALLSALAQTPIEMAGNLLQIGALKNVAGSIMKKGVNRSALFVETLLKGVIGEGGEEFLQQYPDELSNIYAAHPEWSAKEVGKEFIRTIKETTEQAGKAAVVGGLGGLMLAGATSGPALAGDFAVEKYKDKSATRDAVDYVNNVFSDLVPKKKDVGKSEEVLNNMTEAAVEGSKDLPVMEEEVKSKEENPKEVKKLETPLDQDQQNYIDARIVGLGSLEAVKKEYKKADDASIYAREKAAEIYGGDPGVEVLKQKMVKPAGKYDTIGSGFDTQKGKVIPFKKEWMAKKKMKLAAQKAGADVSEYDVRKENGGWVFQRREIEIPKSEKKLETPEVKDVEPKFITELKDKASKTKDAYASRLIKDFKDLDPELAKNATSEAALERLVNMADAKLVKRNVAPTIKDIDYFYRPAVRIDKDNIFYVKKGMHITALEKAFKELKINPETFDYDRVSGTGGVGPDGHYYESGFIGDVPDNAKGFKNLTEDKSVENRQKKADPIDDYISKEEFKNQDLDFVRSEMRKAVDDIMKGSKKKQIETLQKLKKFYKRKEDAGFLRKLDEKILKLEGGGKEKATASNQVLGKPGYKKGELVPWKMEHYATKKAKEMTEKTGVVWEKTGSKEKGWLVQETGEKVVKENSKKELPTTYYHGTSKANAKKIIAEGFKKVDPESRFYTYSQLGEGVIYGATKDSDIWFQPGDSRRVTYEKIIPFNLKKGVNVRIINTVKEANALAKEVGFKDIYDLEQNLFFDGYDFSNPERYAEAAKPSQNTIKKLKAAGIDGIDFRIDPKINDLIAPQVVIFDPNDIVPERSKIDAVAGKKEKKKGKILAAIKDPETGEIYSGPGIHETVRRQMLKDGIIGPGKKSAWGMENGFVDESGWLTREDARKKYGSGAMEVIKPGAEKEAKNYSGPKLTTGLDPVDGIKAVIQTGKDIKEALPHLKALGEKFYTGGKQKYFDWQKKMKAAIGDAWGKVKNLVQKVWNEIKESHFIKKLFDQSGSVDITALQKVFGKAPKADSLYSKFIKAGVIKEDLMLSGIGGYLKELGRERVDWGEFKDIVSEGGGFGVEKKTFTSTDDTLFNPEENPQYNLAGESKESYKETLYKYNPNDGSRFIEDHWEGADEQINTMVHERGHDRIVDGDKDVRYVDEVQSKWHDKGGKEGYGKTIKVVTKEEFEARIKEIEDDFDAGIITQQQAETLAIMAEARMLQSKYQSISVPNAPFKKSWPQMVMRDVISDAVARGKDGVTWSTGKIQEERWPKVKTDFRSLYDKKIKKFMEKESGVKAELVETSTDPQYELILEEFEDLDRREAIAKDQDTLDTIRAERNILKNQLKRNSEKVWYVPITDKLKTRYQDKQITVFDTVLNPIMNQNGSVNLGNLKKLSESVYNKKQSYFEWQKEVKRIVGDAWEKVKKFVGKIWKELKTPVSNERGSVTLKQGKEKVKDKVRLSKKDFTPFELEKGDQQVNTGKDSNKNIKVGIKDAERIASLTTKGSKFRAFVPTEFMFDKYPEIRPLLSQAREVDKTVTKQIGEFAKELKKIEKKFPNKKEREKLGISWHYMNKSGEAAMKALGHEKPENVKYQELKDTLDPIFNYFVTAVNDIRSKLGKKPIKINKDYLTFYATENYITDFKNLATGNNQDLVINNLILDDWGAIKARQNIYTKDSAPFAHVKRKGLREGIKLELDPLVVVARYGKEAINHINKSPLIAFTKELIKSDLIHPETGEKFNLSKDNLVAARDLSSWINMWGGQSNLNVPKYLERIGNKVANNLTVAQLFGNLRTAIIQVSALGPTAWKFGYFNTMKGISDITFGNKTIPFEESSALPTASWDVTADEFANAIGKSKLKKAGLVTKEASAFFMKGIDYLARKATFATVYRSLKPLVKAGKLSKKEAVRITDAEVIRTQASGSKTEISPIQRNILGKMATLWQTFTINQLNFIMRDIVGVSGKKVGLVERNKRIFRTLFGLAMMEILYEKVMGIQSPFPALIQVVFDKKKEDSNILYLRKVLLELSEGFPFGGSVKFGSDVEGPVADYIEDIVKVISGKGDYNQDILKIALYGKGNAKIKARLKILELVGKAKGIPGTSQFVKYAKGRLRGEGHLRSAMGTLYNESEGSGSSGNYLRRATYQKRQTR